VLDTLKATGLILLLASTPALAQDEAADAAADTTAEATDAEATDEVEAAADDEPEGETFPIGASLSLSHSFAHSEFVEDDSGMDSAGQFLSLGLNLRYSVIEKVGVSASISVLKAVDAGFLSGTSGSNLVNYETVLSDLNLGARWSMYTVPVAEIPLALSVGLRLPTSKSSLTRGLIMAPRVSLSASRKFGDLSLSINGGYSHNIWENATQQIEPRFAELIQISGADLGRALPLSGWNIGGSLSYAILESLSASISYSLSNGVSSVYGKDDEYTPQVDGVQTGYQLGTGAHSFSASLNYTLPTDTGTSLGASMSTAMGLYSGDNQRITNVLFDTESEQGLYTGYSISLSQAL